MNPSPPALTSAGGSPPKSHRHKVCVFVHLHVCVCSFARVCVCDLSCVNNVEICVCVCVCVQAIWHNMSLMFILGTRRRVLFLESMYTFWGGHP